MQGRRGKPFCAGTSMACVCDRTHAKYRLIAVSYATPSGQNPSGRAAIPIPPCSSPMLRDLRGGRGLSPSQWGSWSVWRLQIGRWGGRLRGQRWRFWLASLRCLSCLPPRSRAKHPMMCAMLQVLRRARQRPHHLSRPRKAKRRMQKGEGLSPERHLLWRMLGRKRSWPQGWACAFGCLRPLP